jgi:transcriptional regulator with PAS, ATPase and Fis domain
VLLPGESGSGKEVVGAGDTRCESTWAVRAHRLRIAGEHSHGKRVVRARQRLGGATENKKGLVELADGGAVFFDEIGDLPFEMQVKLLRLVQEKEFRAVGSLQSKRLDLRMIAATHRDLKARSPTESFAWTSTIA